MRPKQKCSGFLAVGLAVFTLGCGRPPAAGAPGSSTATTAGPQTTPGRARDGGIRDPLSDAGDSGSPADPIHRLDATARPVGNPVSAQDAQRAISLPLSLPKSLLSPASYYAGANGAMPSVTVYYEASPFGPLVIYFRTGPTDADMADQAVAANGSGEVLVLEGGVHAFFLSDGVAATLIYPRPGAGSVSFVGRAGPKVKETLVSLANESLAG